ncbi:NUDIX domain-containing protein [Gordonia phosphorivorans]|uniref:NUDIX domain-containing protein n=1 Tax=Gordonia phosphorivorans TaxID=1056982 RepID=A0ABV6H5K6_9ACTN
MTPTPRTQWAAGGVLWRTSSRDGVEVAVVHRPRYDDWSLPKGKTHNGELLIATAARETVEETGYDGRVGRHLGTVEYTLKPGVEKKVAYWSIAAGGGRFVANHETDDVQWLPVDGAARTVSYDADRAILAAFSAYPADELHQLVVVRHATAGRRSRSSKDHARALDDNGAEQARALVGLLGLFGPAHLHAADRRRCVQTLEPLSRELRSDIVIEPTLTEEACAADPDASYARLRELAAPTAGVRVLCSQGKAIGPLLKRWAQEAGVTLPSTRTRKGATWMLTLRGDTLVQADYLPSPFGEQDRR